LIKRKSSLRNKSPAAVAGWGGCQQHVGVGASRNSASRDDNNEKDLGEIFYTGGVGEQQPVGGEEQQQPGVPCGSGDGACEVRNSTLSTSLLPVAIGGAVVEARAAARNGKAGLRRWRRHGDGGELARRAPCCEKFIRAWGRGELLRAWGGEVGLTVQLARFFWRFFMRCGFSRYLPGGMGGEVGRTDYHRTPPLDNLY
jgi:hypothetical protein